MALNLSQLLGGAGVAAGSMRQAEEAERVARQNQLAIEERNRLDQLRVAQEALSRSMESPAPAFQFDMGVLPVRQIAAPTPAAGPAAPGVAPPMSREQAAFLEANVEYPPAGRGEVPPTPVAAATQSLNSLEDQKVQLMKQLREASGGGRGRAAIYKQIDDINRQIAAARSQVTQAQRATGVTGIRVPTPAAAPAAAAPVSTDPTTMFAGLEQKYNLPAGVLNAVMMAESGGRPGQTSKAGAQGYFQFMPKTAKQYGVTVNDLGSEAEGAARMLSDLLAMTGGDLDKALAGYNWGIGNVRRKGMEKMPAETRNYIPKVMAYMQQPAAPGAAPAAPTAAAPAAPTAAAPAAPTAAAPTPALAEGAPATGAAPVRVKTSATYLKNPEAITQDMRVAMQQRDYMAKLARLYENAGMGPQALEIRAKVMEMDNGMIYLQGMRGIEEFSLAGDPRRLAAVWSAYFGAPVGVQRRSDGLFDVLADGERVLEGLSANAVVDRARSSFDTAFRKQKAEAAATAGMEEFKSVLRRQEQQGKDLAQMIREIAVERVQGNNAQALEWAKANYNWDIRPTGSGDGSVIIRPPGGSPYLFNPTGKTIEIDGVKVQSNAAYPIAGLPTYGGVQPNR